MSAPAPWFRAAVARGLVRLVALSLPGTPPADTIELTREAWIEALWPSMAWDADLDEPRIAEAFRQLTLAAERWPAPVHLLRALPARAERPKLTAPPLSADDRRRALKHIAAVVELLKRRQTQQ